MLSKKGIHRQYKCHSNIPGKKLYITPRNCFRAGPVAQPVFVTPQQEPVQWEAIESKSWSLALCATLFPQRNYLPLLTGPLPQYDRFAELPGGAGVSVRHHRKEESRSECSESGDDDCEESSSKHHVKRAGFPGPRVPICRTGRAEFTGGIVATPNVDRYELTLNGTITGTSGAIRRVVIRGPTNLSTQDFSGGILFDLTRIYYQQRGIPVTNELPVTLSLTRHEAELILSGAAFIEVQTSTYPEGELRGPIVQPCSSAGIGLDAFFKNKA